MDEKLNKHISKVQLPNEQVYNVVPEAVKNGEYVINSPVLSADTEFVITSQNQTITGLKTFSKRPLSKDIYTKLEYIRSNATSSSVFPYIRTGVKRGVDYTNSETLSCVLDGYFTASQTYGFCGYDSGGQLGQANGKWSTEAGTSSVSALTRATVTQVLNFSSSYDRLYINGSQIANRTISSASNHAQSADYPLFVAYNGNFTYNPAKLVMYSFKMYIGDYATSPSTATLIRDFIPAKDPHGNIGLFDLVHQKFYKNFGNENFVAGEEVETFGIDASLLTSYDVAKVAMTNDYADLDNKPSIPTVNNGTLTIQKNGTTVATFTANQSENTTANIDLSDYATTGYVDTAIQGIGNPMVFKGSVGTGGTVTWANLPAASSSEGFTYKVITDHSTAPVCKVGDTIISNGSSWVVIPSGDEPSGTVTSVGAQGASGSHISVSGSPITSSGTLSIGVDSGYSIPSNTDQSTWSGKQDALTTSSVNDGTLNKVIGFDSSGNLVKNVQSGGMSNPMTTAGDIIVGGSSGTPTRLGKGTSGQVLKVNSAGTALEWGNVGGGGPAASFVDWTVDGYQVTIIFQHSTWPEDWESTRIYKDYTVDGNSVYVNSSDEIGSISSADGTTTVNTSTGKLLILSGSGDDINLGTINTGTNITNTGDGDTGPTGHGDIPGQPNIYIDNVLEYMNVSPYSKPYGMCCSFAVSGNGTITIDGTYWADY